MPACFDIRLSMAGDMLIRVCGQMTAATPSGCSDRRIVEVLATGESTKLAASRLDLSVGRISQLRQKLHAAWLRIQGEDVSVASPARRGGEPPSGILCRPSWNPSFLGYRSE